MAKISQQDPFTDGNDEPQDDEPEAPELLSDGKRMRLVWKRGDGDGDSSAHVVERSMNLVRGHPTWKIFIDDIPIPIQRGSKEEPPHHVYLDDRACYAVYCSKAYSNDELRKFWPWDFNHQGNIRQGRFNRGHAAYLDDSYTELAKGRLRAKNQWYTFHGAPDEGKYEPLRPKKDTHIEAMVAKEYAEKAEGDKSNEETPESEPADEEPTTPGKKKGKAAMDSTKDVEAGQGSPAKANQLLALPSTPRGKSARTPEKSPSPTKTISPSKRMSKMKLGNDTPSPTARLGGTLNTKQVLAQDGAESPTKSSPLKRRNASPTVSGSPMKRAHVSKPFQTSSSSEEDGPSLFE